MMIFRKYEACTLVETLQLLAHKDHDAGPVGTQKNVVAAHSKGDNARTVNRVY